MNKMQKGFTLIELMIVVAIIAILAAIAIPAYQNYLIRSQVSEGFTLMDGAKVAITEYHANHGKFPTGNGAAGVSPASSIAGKYVESVTISGDGLITSKFSTGANSKIGSKDVTLTPTVLSGKTIVTWTCGGSVQPKYRPSSCR